MAFDEPTRPQYHFTPPAHWMNDPNGMVYYQGEYHLFYQYYPGGFTGAGGRFADPLKWGPMHWGHAVSRDLVRWEHLPVALYPDTAPGEEDIRGMIFSGSAVVDWNNTSGLGQGEVLVAFYTLADVAPGDGQRQAIAYSTDRGRTWTKYAGNPVLPNPGRQDFRDPKVFWHEPTGRWVMILAVHDRVELYTSADLKSWTYASEFGDGHGARGLPWECPDLFPLPVNGDPEQTKWAMLVSVGQGAPYGGSGTQYFIGDFDGRQFTSDNPADRILWLDYGRDNYAGVTWSDHPDNARQRLFIGWMSNWDYANDVPTTHFRSAMTLPRVLTLKSFPEGVRLVTRPLPALATLRRQPELLKLRDLRLDGSLDLPPGETLEIEAEFRLEGNAAEFGFRLRQGGGCETVVGYSPDAASLFVDRSRSGSFAFKNDRGRHAAPLEPDDGVVGLHLFLDRTSVEVFGNGGRQVITGQIFPPPEAVGAEVYASQGAVTLRRLTVHQLGRIHP